jgi:hypothetical protein
VALWQVSVAPKCFGGGFEKKKKKNPPPTLTPQPPHSQTARLSASLTKPPPQNTPPHHSLAENATQQITCDACMLGCTIFKTHRMTLDETLIKSCPSLVDAALFCSYEEK